LIVDDHSTDDSREVAEKLLAEIDWFPATLLARAASAGPAAASNVGFNAARSQHALALDAALARKATRHDDDAKMGLAFITPGARLKPDVSRLLLNAFERDHSVCRINVDAAFAYATIEHELKLD
jgi:glycosyltransferase involved in cell wall biosynthesis